MPAQDNSSPIQTNPVQPPLQGASSVPTAPAGLSPILEPGSTSGQGENVSGAQQTPSPTGPEVPPSPKKGFPKIVTILGIVVLIAVLAYAVWKFVLPRWGESEEITLTWWGLWEDSSIVTPLISEYEQQNPNIKINYVKQSHQDYRERLTNALAQGSGPDIFRFHNTWVPMFKGELDSVPASVMSAAEYAESYFSIISSDLTNETGLAGIPLGYDALTLYINEDLFEAAGKSAPATWDDLRQLAIELTTKDEEGTITQAGVALGRTENVDHWPEILGLMMLQNGANPAKPIDQRAEDALTYFTIFSSSDGVWDETLPASTVSFAAGKLAMYFGPTWRAFEISQQSPELRFKTVPLPQLPKDTPTQPDISYATYWAEGVWTRGSNKDAAWDFMEFISSRASLESMYQNASATRAFGEPYPRTDMAELLTSHPIVGSVVVQAPDAQSWYLASRTFDGPTGINTQIIKYYEDAINAVNSGERSDKALETVVTGVAQVLSQYGLVSR
jgi:multiple sugar transport system substrate-binding protein